MPLHMAGPRNPKPYRADSCHEVEQPESPEEVRASHTRESSWCPPQGLRCIWVLVSTLVWEYRHMLRSENFPNGSSTRSLALLTNSILRHTCLVICKTAVCPSDLRKTFRAWNQRRLHRNIGTGSTGLRTEPRTSLCKESARLSLHPQPWVVTCA